MAQIEGVYIHEKLDGVEYAVPLFESASEAGDCCYECGYNGQKVYAPATEDKTSEAYQKYGTPATFKRKDGTEFWLLTQPYSEPTEENYLTVLSDIEDSGDGGTYALAEHIDTNAESVAYEVESAYSDWLSIAEPTLSGVVMTDVSVSPGTGSGEVIGGGAIAIVTETSVVVSANADGTSRTGRVKVTGTFSDGSTMTDYITVTQGVPNYLNVTDINATSQDNKFYFLSDYVDTNAVSYQATSNASWLSIRYESDGDNDVLCVVPSGNTSESSRTGTVTILATFADGSTQTATITVTQEGGVTFTVNPTPSDATVTINGTVTKSVTVASGTTVTWTVEAEGYISASGSQTVTANTTKDVKLVWDPYYTYNTASASCYFIPSNYMRLGTELGLHAEVPVTVARSGTAPTLTAKIKWYRYFDSMGAYSYVDDTDSANTSGLTVTVSGAYLRLYSPFASVIQNALEAGSAQIKVEVTVLENDSEVATFEFEDEAYQLD